MKKTFYIIFLSLLNIFFTFLFQWYLLIKLGPGLATDSYFAGSTLPVFMMMIVGTSLTHVLVPFFAGESKTQMRNDAWIIFYLMTCLFLLITAILYLSSQLWVPLIFPGLSGDSKYLVIEISKIQLVAMFFLAVNSVQLALLRAKERFVQLECILIASNMTGFFLLINLLPVHGVISAAWVNLFQAIFQMLLLLPIMGNPVLVNYSKFSIKIVLRRIYPLIFGNIYFKSDIFVDRFLLSTMYSGTLSLYFFVQQIYGAFNLLINRVMVGPMVPVLSRMYKSNDSGGFWAYYYLTLSRVGVIVIFTLATIFFLGQNILDFFIGYGGVTKDNIQTIWYLMISLSGTLIAGILSTVTTSTFYSLADTFTPTKISLYLYPPYIFIKIIAFNFWGLTGLAIATSADCVLNFLAQFYLLRKRYLNVTPRN